MLKKLLFIAICTVVIFGIYAAQNQPVSLALQDISVEQYGKFELAFDVPGTFDNPYDTNVVDIGAVFTDPNGRTTRVPAFYAQIYTDQCRPEQCTVEDLRPTGDTRWQVRFAPTVVGEWRYLISGTVNSDNIRIGEGSFTVTPSANKGFIRVADNNQYFEFEDRTPFFPIGHNLAWSWDNGGGLYEYINWLDSLQAVGANYARINIDIPWFIGLEWTSPPGQYNDFGQESAYRFDRILAEAEARDIYLQVTLIWHQSFREYTGLPVNIPTEPARPNQSADFDNHPYNTTQGGNLTGAGDILYNSIAQGWLQRRLRYVMARYSYSPAIFSWEIIDSIDRIAQFETARGLDWLELMIQTVRENDVNNHLISVGSRSFSEQIQGYDGIDFAQVNIYQRRPIEDTQDQTQLTFSTLATSNALVNKPVIINEFSINPWFEPAADDPSGIHIQNTMWASILNGSAGSAMPFWWDTYLDPQNLYTLYTPIRLFTDGIAWGELDLQTVEPSLIMPENIAYEPIIIDDFNPTFGSASPPDAIYHLTADGTTPPTSLMSSYLYGQRYNATNASPETFIISPAVNTLLTIQVASVSNSADARLEITIDGQTALAIDLSAGTGATAFSLPLNAGKHTVIFENSGEDWLQIGAIEIREYTSPLHVFALADTQAGTALAWIHHRDYTWSTVQGAQTISPIEAQLSFSDMPNGNYRIEYWDPFTGNVIGEDFVTLTEVDNGELVAALLPIDQQLAVRIFRISGPDGIAIGTNTNTVNASNVNTSKVEATPRPSPTFSATMDINATDIPIN